MHSIVYYFGLTYKIKSMTKVIIKGMKEADIKIEPHTILIISEMIEKIRKN